LITEVAGPVYALNLVSIRPDGEPVIDDWTSQSFGFRLTAGFGF
jgi:hypothetical protein